MANVTLNDFRAVLGTRNDGNIVLNQDGKGFHKVNFGRVVTHLPTPVNEANNKEIRELLYQSICASTQGRVLAETTMQRIRNALHIHNGKSYEGSNVERTLVERVLSIVDENATSDLLMHDEIARMCRNGAITTNEDSDLANRVAAHVLENEFLANPEVAAQIVCGKRTANFLPSVTDKEMAKFIKNNFQEIKARIFIQRYWLIQNKGADAATIEEQLHTRKSAQMLGDAIYALMRDFAEKKTPPSASMAIPPSPLLDERAVAQYDTDTQVIAENERHFNFYVELGAQKAEDALAALAQMSPAGSRSARILKGFSDIIRAAVRREFAAVVLRSPDNYRQEIDAPGGFRERFADKFDAIARFVEELGEFMSRSQGIDGEIPDYDRFRTAIAARMRGVDASNYDVNNCLEVLLGEMQKFSRPYSVRNAIEASIKAKYQENPEDGRRVSQRVLAEFDGYVNGRSQPAEEIKALINACRAWIGEVYKVNTRQPEAPRATDYGVVYNAVDQWCGIVEGEMERERVRREGAAAGVNKAARDIVAIMDQQLRPELRPHRTDEEAVALGRKTIAEFLLGAEAANELDAEQLKANLIAQPAEKIKLAVSFVSRGYLRADEEIVESTNRQDFRPLRQLILDGVVDLGQLDLMQSEQLKLLIKANYCSLGYHQIFACLDIDEARRTGKCLSISFAQDLVAKGEAILAEVKASGNQERIRICQEWFSETGSRLVRGGNPEEMFSAAPLVASEFGLGSVRGFKDTSPEATLALMKECNIGLKDLSDIRAVEKLLGLMYFSQLNPTGLDGLVEFVERVTGKELSKFDFSDVMRLNLGFFHRDGDVNDGLPKLFSAEKEAEKRKVVDALVGTRKLADSGIPIADVAHLSATVQGLATAEAGATQAVTLKGIPVLLEKRASGSFSATINGVRFHVGTSGADIVHFAEDMIVNHAGDPVNAELAKAVLDRAATAPLLRRRELAVKALVAILGESSGVTSVRLASTSTDELVRLAGVALAGNRSADALAKIVTAFRQGEVDAYYSIDMVEMQREVVRAETEEPGSTAKVVKMNSSSDVRSINERELVTTAADVHRLASDLLVNSDHWDADEAAFGGKAPAAGERLRRLLQQYEPELKHIRENPALLATLPIPGAEVLKTIILELAQIESAQLNHAEVVNPRLAEIETRLDKLASEVMAIMQQKVDALFAPRPSDGAELWQKTFGEMSGAKGIDLSTPAGRFANRVLSGYFRGSRLLDQRKMLAELLRNTDAESSDVKLVSELLKGAGPLLQKILQGLPMETFPAETQVALMDMKSRLPSIPDDAVKAQMYQLVQGSNGRILSIDVLGSYGAASVGQAFHCIVRTPEYPRLGIECVVKVLRPNAQVSVEREKALIDQLLDEDQKRSFAGQYGRILQELDFTLEAQNVDIGRITYEQPKALIEYTRVDGTQINDTYSCSLVHSMERVEGMNATMGTMIVKRAPGKTVDGYVTGIEKELAAILDRQPDPIRRRIAMQPGGASRVDYAVRDEGEMMALRERLANHRDILLKRRVSLEQTVHAWFEKALFGTGFFHGDMHAGNVMFDDNGATIIDFGNCSELSQSDRYLAYDLLVCGLCAVPDKLFDAVKERFGGDVEAKIEAVGEDALKAEFAEILNKGTSDDVLKRIQGVLSRLQRHGFNVPVNVVNFFQSSVRLEGVLSAVDDEMAKLDSIIGGIHVDGEIAPELKFTETPDKVVVNTHTVVYENTVRRVVDGTKEVNGFFKALDVVMEGICGDPVKPATEDSVKSLMESSSLRYLSTYDTDYRVMDELNGFSREQVDAVLDKLATRFRHWQDFQDKFAIVRKRVNTYFALAEDPNSDPEAVRRAKAEVNHRFRQLVVAGIANMIDRNFGLVKSGNVGLNFTRGMAFADLASEVIYGHFEDLKVYMLGNRKSWSFLFVGIPIIMPVSKYEQAMTHRSGVYRRVRVSRRQLRRANQELPQERRLAASDIDKIEKTVADFCAPLRRPYQADGWMKVEENLVIVAKMVVDDLKRLSEALGTATLSPEAVNHAFQLYSAYDGGEDDSKFAAALQALKSNDNALATVKAKIAELAGDPDVVKSADDYFAQL